MEVAIIPNPSKGKIRVVSPITIESIEIYDPFGEIISHQVFHSSSTSIDLSSQPKGIYILKTKLNNGGACSSKLIKI